MPRYDHGLQSASIMVVWGIYYSTYLCQEQVDVFSKLSVEWFQIKFFQGNTLLRDQGHQKCFGESTRQNLSNEIASENGMIRGKIKQPSVPLAIHHSVRRKFLYQRLFLSRIPCLHISYRSPIQFYFLEGRQGV